MERGSSGSHNLSRSKSQRRKNYTSYNCGKKGQVKKDCCYNKKIMKRALEATNSQGGVESTSNDGEILYGKAAISKVSK